MCMRSSYSKAIRNEPSGLSFSGNVLTPYNAEIIIIMLKIIIIIICYVELECHCSFNIIY